MTVAAAAAAVDSTGGGGPDARICFDCPLLLLLLPATSFFLSRFNTSLICFDQQHINAVNAWIYLGPVWQLRIFFCTALLLLVFSLSYHFVLHMSSSSYVYYVQNYLMFDIFFTQSLNGLARYSLS